jgi:ribose 5-phosphate isomerase
MEFVCRVILVVDSGWSPWQVDSNMNLIKGGGAAHTMEKVVDSIAKECVILIDETKIVKTLGLSFPLPVEVLPFALAPVLRALAALGGQPEIRTALRKDGPVITDLVSFLLYITTTTSHSQNKCVRVLIFGVAHDHGGAIV